MPAQLGHDNVQKDDRRLALQRQGNGIVAIGCHQRLKSHALHDAGEDALHPDVVVHNENGQSLRWDFSVLHRSAAV